MATPDDIPHMAYKPSPPDDIQSMASNEHLALNHVLDNILGIPTSSTVQFAFSAFWIYTIDDLMTNKPSHDLRRIHLFNRQ
jgi:hypothetical protein